MRVIGGRLKGRRLAGPGRLDVRPTSDSLRETLFNILGDAVERARVLDAFAGTGALGLEALSRGAAHVTFIENDPRVLGVLRENVTRCGVENSCAIIRQDLREVPSESRPSRTVRVPRTDQPATRPQSFDLVLLDPPYDVGDLSDVVSAASPLLAPGGQLVLEHSRRRVSPEAAPGLRRVRLVTAGDSALSFYTSDQR